MINEEVLKLRNTYESAKANIVRVINEAYGMGLPFYLINAIIEDIGYQLRPLMDDEAKQAEQTEQPTEDTQPTPADEEKGEQEANE